MWEYNVDPEVGEEMDQLMNMPFGEDERGCDDDDDCTD